jgi:hypothetical protein
MCGEWLGRFRELLLGDVPLARQALRKLLPQPLKVFPAVVEGRRTLRFKGSTTSALSLRPAFIKVCRPHGD